MDCSKILELLPLYSEDVLDDREKSLVEEHLKTCDSCRGELEFFKKIQTQMMNLPEIEPSERFKEGLSRRLKEEKRKKTAFYMSGGFKKAATIAMSAAVIAICITALDTEPYKNNEEILNGKDIVALSDGKTDDILTNEIKNQETNQEINAKTVTKNASADTLGEAKKEIQKDDKNVIEEDKATPKEDNEPIAEASLPLVVGISREQNEAVYDSGQGAETTAETQNTEAMATNEEETTTPKARISGGGGGTSSTVSVEEKQSLVKRTLKISFPDNEQSHLEILKSYDMEDGVYKVPANDFDRVTGELVAIPDCIAVFESEDFSDEYNKLTDSGESQERLLEIQDIISYGYIIIE